MSSKQDNVSKQPQRLIGATVACSCEQVFEMNSLERRHSSRRGSTQGHRKYSDGFSDTSSAGMDDTDREVSNLTDRAFRSLCIGEEAIYNDSEISSPTERHKAFADEAQRKEVLKSTCQETLAYGIQYEGTERRSEVTSTFQHSSVDIAEHEVLRDEHLSYTSNGSVEATWQQRRSTSRVSSLIKAFSSREGYYDSGTPDALLLKDKNRDFNNESWDRSAVVSLQRELSDFSSSYHQNFKSGPFQSYRNHFHTSAAVTRMDTSATFLNSSKNKFKSLNSTNFFFHSEFSPFQLWKDYNRFPFGREVPGFVSASEFPRWYDSPLYKELTTAPRISSPHSEGKRFNRRQIEDVVTTQRSKSTIVQKAPTVEKRCESEMASNLPPWKRNNNFVQNKLPSNRPSTVSPTHEKSHRPDSSLLSHGRYTNDIQNKVEKVNSTFNITQLLTPVIHGRHDTETSEILQFAHTPSVPDCSLQSDTDLKLLPDVQHLRDSYKSKASSLLFNLKDNRKRVKSTYTPTTFKGLELTDRNKQPSKLDDIECRLLDTSVSQVDAHEHSTVTHTLDKYNIVQKNYEVSSSQNVEHNKQADASHDNVMLASQYRPANYKMSYGSLQGNSLPPDKFSSRQSEEYEVTAHMLSAQDGAIKNSEGHIYDPSRTLIHTRPEIENILPKAPQPAHSLSAQVSEKQIFSRRDVADSDLKERTNFDRKPNIGYANVLTEDKASWNNPAPVNSQTNKENFKNVSKDTFPFKGEIAALIEMDKQRKATAKQYLPATHDSNTVGKDTYLNKINDKIKQGRLEKEEMMQDTEMSLQIYPYAGFQNRSVQNNPTNTHLTSKKLYGYQNTGLQKMSLSPPKESNLTGKGAEIKNTNNHLQRGTKYHGSDILIERNYSQRTQQSPLSVEKHQKNEGSVAYQPYKYDPNKQWCITASENRQMKNEINPSSLPQTDVNSEEKDYSYPMFRPSYSNQQSAENTRTTQRNLVTEDRSWTTEHKQNDSLVSKQIDQIKNANMKTDFTKPNIHGAEQTFSSSQVREDRFSINDILSIRDNEQAKRQKESKPSPNTSVSESTTLENQPSPVMSDIAEGKATKMDASKLREQKAQDQNLSFHKHGNTDLTPDNIGKESQNPAERSINIVPGLKDKSGKDTFISKDNDKITTRAVSHKERSQTKQEILTSKLKAHAQKEISAIKEKELAKQGIMSRNPIKQITAVNNERGQMSLEVLPLKKEITAEKLNHFFQDITYSSVTLYKEKDMGGLICDSVSAEESKSSTKARGSPAEDASSYKNNDTVKDNTFSPNDKEIAKIHSLSERVQTQDERLAMVEKKTGEVQKSPKNYFLHTHLQSAKNQSSNSDNTDKQKSNALTVDDAKKLNALTVDDARSSGSHKALCKQPSVVKTEHQTFSNQPLHSENHMEKPSSTLKGSDSPKSNLLRKTSTSIQGTYNITEQATPPHHSVNKATEPPSIKEDKLTAYICQKHTDLRELVKETSGMGEANSYTETKKDAEIGKNVPAVENTDTTTGLPTSHRANAEEEVGIKIGFDYVSANQTRSCIEVKSHTSVTYNKHLPEDKKENESQAKHNTKVQPRSPSKINTDSSTKEPCHLEEKSPENVSTNKGLENQTSKPQKQESEQKSFQSKHEIKDANSHNTLVKRTDIVSESKMESLQQDIDRPPDGKNQTQNNLQQQVAAMKNKPSENESIEINNKPPSISEKTTSSEKSHTINITTNTEDKQMSSQNVSECADNVNPAPECDTIHIPDNEAKTSADEPVIYSIRISSKSEVISEEEPVIYTICVSSLSDISKTDDPDKSDFGQKQLPADDVHKELSIGKNEKTEEQICSEIKQSDNIEAREYFNNTKVEKAPSVRTDITSPAESKNDHYKSDNINSCYESLLAKYGFLVRDNVNIKTAQDKVERNGKEDGENLSQKEQKRTTYEQHASVEEMEKAETGKMHIKELNKFKTLKEFSEPLNGKNEEKRGHHIPHSIKKHDAAEGEYTQKAVGLMGISDKHIKDKYQHFENSKQISQVIPAKQNGSISKAAPPCEDNQEIPSTGALKPNITAESVPAQGNMQVRQKEQTMYAENQKGLKAMENSNVGGKNAGMLAVECIDDNQMTNSHKMKISSTTKIKNSTRILDNNSNENSSMLNSKTSVTVTEDTKASKSNGKKYDQAYSKIQRQDAGVHIDTHVVKLNQNVAKDTPKTNDPKYRTQKESETNPGKIEALTKKSSTTKDNKTLQNSIRECIAKEEEQDKFRRSDEYKDKAVRHVLQDGILTFAEKQIVSETSSISGNLLRNTSTVVNTDQSLHKVLNILSKDKVVHTNKLDSNKDSVKTVKNKLYQHEQIAMTAKGIVLSERENANVQNISVEKATREKSAPAEGMTEADLKKLGNQKWKESRENENVMKEIKGVNTDNTKIASSLVIVEKDTECALKMSNKVIKEGSAQTQDKKQDGSDKAATEKVKIDTGQTKGKTGTITMDKDEGIKDILPVKHDDHINVYQYHPGKGFLPETRGKTHEDQSSDGSNGQNVAPGKKECTLNKPVITQQEKKTNKPEISALADYARLRVISADDDITSEKDLLKNLDMYRKYNLSAMDKQKSSPGGLSKSVGPKEPTEEVVSVKNHESQTTSQTTKSLHVKEKDMLLFQKSKNAVAKHEKSQGQVSINSKLSSLDKISGEKVFVGEVTGSTLERTLTNQMQSITKASFTEQHQRQTKSNEIHQMEKSHVVQAPLSKTQTHDSSNLRQPVYPKMLEKNDSHTQSQEHLPHSSLRSEPKNTNKQEDNPLKTKPREANDDDKMDELQYYTVHTTESEPKPDISDGTDQLSSQTTSKKEVAETTTLGSRSNSSSPAMGKPIMFRVKNNTIRNSPVTKSVKPVFRRSFSEELFSPKEIRSGSVNADIDHGHVHDANVSAKPLALHEPTVSSYRLPRVKEIQSSLTIAEVTSAKEPRSSLRRSQQYEDDETRSVISTVSEDVESIEASSVVMTDSVASHVFETESGTYSRPESACYERPPSSCYDRPESACSDIRPFGKPPSVPPKSEKALRRAKRLTTRRNQKFESKMTSDNQGQLENRSVRGVSSLPSSPMEMVSTHRALLASPPVTQYHVDPNYIAPVPNIVAQPFPVTQRKLLQDPNSGQYFMVDMPMQVKTKTFFDPETGKYIQLNVRQRSQSAISQAQRVEVLNHPCVVYPGFLPMPVSSLPTLRSSSQISAPATLSNEQKQQDPNSELRRRSGDGSLYTGNNGKNPSRQTDIITTSELEDFAMES